MTHASDLFWKQVDKSGDCWLWTGRDTNKSGYARFSYHIAPGKQVREQVHRFAYEDIVGPIPSGLTIDHLCRTPLCVNPAHLEPVTMRENIMRSDNVTAQNARKTHCPQGHPYDEANTHINKKGQRICRQCGREKALATYHAKRAAAGFAKEVYPGLRTHCPYGHEYTPANTYTHLGRRHCVICTKQRSREHYLKQKQQYPPAI